MECLLTCPAPREKPRVQESMNIDAHNPLMAIGAELKFAFVAIGGLFKYSTADNDFWLRKCRELFLRPAVEPILLAHWDKLRTFEMKEPQLANLCSRLCGSMQRARTRDIRGLWDGGSVLFEPPEQARRWRDDIQSVAKNPELTPLLPAYCFARTIIAHPYPDGNGRLARALVHAALARTFDYRAPFLPLAPAFYMNGARVAVALRELCEAGDWTAFNAVFWRVIEDSQALARRLRPSRE